MRYLYAIFSFILYVLFTIFASFLSALLSENQLIEISQAYVFTHAILMIFVLGGWLIIQKFTLRYDFIINKNKPTYFYFLIVAIPTFIFVFYKTILMNETLTEELTFDKFLYFEIVYFTFIPIIEEIVFRDIIFKLIIKGNMYFNSFFISFLFVLIHIDPKNIDISYLVYIFFNGLALFYIRANGKLIHSILAHVFINLLVFAFQYSWLLIL